MLPNVFKLYKKNETEPANWHKIDEEICAAIDDQVDSVQWCRYWMDGIGLAIACGKPLGSAELRKHVTEHLPNQVPILDFLEANYRSDALVEIGKR